MKKEEKNNTENQRVMAGSAGATTPPVLTIDVEKFEHYLDDSDLSKSEKQEFLQEWWRIIQEFIMLGWNVHPLQMIEPCGQDAESEAEGAILTRDMVESTLIEQEKEEENA